MNLFDTYQDTLAFINRRVSIGLSTQKEGCFAKRCVFKMYQDLRSYPEYDKDYSLILVGPDDVTEFNSTYDGVNPLSFILNYRGQRFPVYNDDYGQQDFIVFKEHEIRFTYADWWYELDRLIDKIDE